jgi:hypothetical protein
VELMKRCPAIPTYCLLQEVQVYAVVQVQVHAMVLMKIWVYVLERQEPQALYRVASR